MPLAPGNEYPGSAGWIGPEIRLKLARSAPVPRESGGAPFRPGNLLRIAIRWMLYRGQRLRRVATLLLFKNADGRPLAGSHRSTKARWDSCRTGPIRGRPSRRILPAHTPLQRRGRTGWLRSRRPDADRRRAAGCPRSPVARLLPARGRDPRFSKWQIRHDRDGGGGCLPRDVIHLIAISYERACAGSPMTLHVVEAAGRRRIGDVRVWEGGTWSGRVDSPSFLARNDSLSGAAGFASRISLTPAGPGGRARRR
jgi:hypothetical protein